MEWVSVLIAAAAPLATLWLADRLQTGRERRAQARAIQDAR